MPKLKLHRDFNFIISCCDSEHRATLERNGKLAFIDHPIAEIDREITEFNLCGMDWDQELSPCAVFLARWRLCRGLKHFRLVESYALPIHHIISKETEGEYLNALAVEKSNDPSSPWNRKERRETIAERNGREIFGFRHSLGRSMKRLLDGKTQPADRIFGLFSSGTAAIEYFDKNPVPNGCTRHKLIPKSTTPLYKASHITLGTLPNGQAIMWDTDTILGHRLHLPIDSHLLDHVGAIAVPRERAIHTCTARYNREKHAWTVIPGGIRVMVQDRKWKELA